MNVMEKLMELCCCCLGSVIVVLADPDPPESRKMFIKKLTKITKTLVNVFYVSVFRRFL